MKNEFGLGDIIIAIGLVITLAFLIIAFATSFGPAAAMMGSGGSFSWPHINTIILWLMVIGAGALLFTKPKMLNVMYIFAGFMILIHIPARLVPYACGNPGLTFFVFVGALLVAAGTYIKQNGSNFITGEKKQD